MCHSTQTQWRCGHLRSNNREVCEKFHTLVDEYGDNAYCNLGMSCVAKVETELCSPCRERVEVLQEQGMREKLRGYNQLAWEWNQANTC